MRDLVKLYEESFKLIIDNPNLTTDKIPNHLLEAWLSDDVIVITNTEQSYFAVSIFHLVHDVYLCLKGIETDPDSKTIERRFNTFQYILALESVHRQYPINLHPVQIGDFDNYGTPPIFDSMPKNFREFMALTEALYQLQNTFKLN